MARFQFGSTASSEDSNAKSALWALGAVVLFSIGLMVALAFMIWFITYTSASSATAEVLLAPVLLVAVVVLILAMGSLTIVFRRLRLHNADGAMGMPEGSIRAVIALMLIVLFFILSIFLLGQLGQQSSNESKTIADLTSAQVDAIPVDRLVSKEITGGTTADPRYTIVQLLPPSEAVQNSSSQLLTTVSTLVVAVAAFYFGSNSVSAAMKATIKPGGSIDGPVVIDLQPKEGPAGTAVTIKGTGFAGASGVTFGATAAARLTVDSDTQITAVSPPGSGVVDVVVTTPAGISATGADSKFTYQAAQPPAGAQ